MEVSKIFAKKLTEPDILFKEDRLSKILQYGDKDFCESYPYKLVRNRPIHITENLLLKMRTVHFLGQYNDLLKTVFGFKFSLCELMLLQGQIRSSLK